jgi:hypothetical protein
MAYLQIWNPTASFTRPNNASAYSSGQLVANSTSAGSVVPMTFSVSGQSMPGQFRLTRLRLAKSGTTATNAQFRVHLYQGATATTSGIVCANGDGGNWSTSQALNYLGSIDVTSMKAFTDGCCDVGDDAANSEHLIRLAAGVQFYALLEARAAYTPVALEVFTLTLEMVEEF